MNPPARIGSLFSGYGGLDMAVEALFGARTVWHADVEPAACTVLAHHWPGVPNLGDVTAVDWSAVERPTILTGGFPCQDVSLAGRRAGVRPGTRSGLWSHFAYAIGQLRPDLVVVENVRGLLSADAACDLEPCPWCVGDAAGRPLRALGAVLGDLADLGYDARWIGLRAADVGAPHGRYRIFIAAWPPADTDGRRRLGGGTRAGSARGAGPASQPEGLGPGPAPADPDGVGSVRARDTRRRRSGSPHDDRSPTDADGAGSQGGWLPGGVGAAAVGDGAPAPAGAGRWGPYEVAIRRWELILGRSAPAPTQTGQRGGQQLSPPFVEWLMGLPQGHVTAVPGLTRPAQLKLLGNGVVPQQARCALAHLLGGPA